MAFKRSKLRSGARKPKKRSRTSLVSKLDQILSLFVRLSFADKNGFVQCYTCPNKKHYKKMQNGHYITRSIRNTRWRIDNCRPQCYGCNIMHGGNPITFRENLVKELGEGAVLFLEHCRHTLFKPDNEWLQDEINFYTPTVEKLIAKTPEGV